MDNLDDYKKKLDKINRIVKDYDPELKRLAVPMLFEAAIGKKPTLKSLQGHGKPDDAESEEGVLEFEEVFSKANPSSESDKALVAGYYLQDMKGQKQFTGREANKLLGDLGHRVKNITDALSKNMDCRPHLVMQIKKRGRSKQAKKDYKLTTKGLQVVRDWIKETKESGT